MDSQGVYERENLGQHVVHRVNFAWVAVTILIIYAYLVDGLGRAKFQKRGGFMSWKQM